MAVIVFSYGWCSFANSQSLTAEQSVKKMQAPDGFVIEVVAAEPLVRQPVAIEFDDRGRLR